MSFKGTYTHQKPHYQRPLSPLKTIPLIARKALLTPILST
jgi:hypothetical protein